MGEPNPDCETCGGTGEVMEWHGRADCECMAACPSCTHKDEEIARLREALSAVVKIAKQRIRDGHRQVQVIAENALDAALKPGGT